MGRRSKKYFRLLLLLLVAAGIFPFLYPPGQPWLSWREVELPQLPSLDVEMEIPELSDLQGDEEKSEPVTVYRWQDEDGGWHFAATPPEGSQAEPMQLDPDANLIRSLPNEQASAEKSEGEPNGPAVDGESDAMEFNYSAEEISELIGKAREARDALDARHQQQAEIIEGQ